ncbi:MAG: CoA transferase, partial [Deltaproteobacteria bacterium]|nr:CoA transferase [Deltaproteobacteria bacterium]MBW2554886.1 CoA transferase [Deltaproteobacteria bacterium]MCK5515184.1 CoA transferase [Deltaproteobacteria bacterium]
MAKALEGIKVLDLSRALAGPYCTMMLADMGAEVIKIEMPGRGDDSRSWGPPFVEGESAYFMSINRNKKSITLNMKSDKSTEIVHKLIKQSDVLVENFRPGAMERLGLGYEQVKAMNPRIIYCSISGFGQDGPYRMLPGFDQVLQGMGGLMSITGELGGPPIKVGVAIADISGGMFASNGILVALYNREKTGKGQMVDVSLLDSQVAWLTYRAGAYFASGEVPQPMGSGHPVIVPYQAFKAKDVFINIAVGNDQLWERFCKAVSLENVMNDPKFATNAKRVENREEIVKIISDLIVTKDGEEWLKILTDAGIPCGPIYTVDKIFADPQVLHREMVKELDHPKAGKVKVTGIPIKLSDTPGEVETAPPVLGQHTQEVLTELGYNDKDLEKLKQEKVI